MRDIKFRGKIYTGEWVTGFYLEQDAYNAGSKNTKKDLISKSEGLIVESSKFTSAVPVDKETIGQYTGLHDKNGKEIYEGDIVTGEDYPFIDEGRQNYIGIVVFYEDFAQFGYEYKCVRKDKKGISNGINNEFQSDENLICQDLEVIGNIYENKDLLDN